MDWQQQYVDSIYAISHDLGAPLRHVQSFASLLREDCTDLSPDHDGWLQHIVDAGALARGQLNGLLTLSRAYSVPPRLRCIAATDCVTLFEQVAPLQVCNIEDMEVSVDADLLQSLYTIIVNNAEAYGEGCRVRAECDEAGLTIVISNITGGLSAEDWTKALLPLNRLGELSTVEHPGVGLCVAQAICQVSGYELLHQPPEGSAAGAVGVRLPKAGTL